MTHTTQPAWDALVAAAPQLLQAAKKSLNWLIAERDCYYEGCSTPEGEVPEFDDLEVLASFDRDIADLEALIRKATGATA